EEFAVLLPETGRPGATAVAERIRLAMMGELRVHGRGGESLTVSLSGGIAVYPEDGDDLGEVLRRADETLYRATAEGKHRIAAQCVERRPAERIGLEGVPLTVTHKKEREPQAVPARGRDISRTGVGLRVGERFDIGENVELSLWA